MNIEHDAKISFKNEVFQDILVYFITILKCIKDNRAALFVGIKDH